MNNIGEKEESWKGGSEKREGGKSLDFRLRLRLAQESMAQEVGAAAANDDR